MAAKEKRITTKDVAAYAGVSPATVSLVLNNRTEQGISADTHKRVVEAAIKVGYLQPNAQVHGAQPRQRDVAVILSDIVNPGMTYLLQTASSFVYSHRLGLLVYCLDRSSAREREALLHMSARGVSGMLYACTPTCHDILERLRHKTPVVVVSDTRLSDTLPTISTDSYQGGALMAQYLYELGHRSIGYITPPINSMSITRRYRLDGLEQTLWSLNAADDLRVYEHTTHIAQTEEPYEIAMGKIQTREVLHKQPDVTAIVAQSDLIAIGVCEALREAGRRVPQDVSVAGFGNTQYGRYVMPRLTTIDTRADQRLKFGLEHLLQLMDGRTNPREAALHAELRSSLIVRDSTAVSPRI